MSTSIEMEVVVAADSEDGNKKRSVVWSYFSFVDDKKDKVICKCGLKLKYVSAFGTSNMKKHISHCSTRILDERDQSNQRIILIDGQSNTVSSPNPVSFSSTVARTRFAEMVIAAESPFSFGDHPFVKRFLQSLRPDFATLSDKTIAFDVDNVVK